MFSKRQIHRRTCMNDPKEHVKQPENERAGQKPQDQEGKDRASNPEKPPRTDPQMDPSHIQEH
jgi:hypothetical protein